MKLGNFCKQTTSCKNEKTIAVYPGCFDPFTNGHLDIVKKAAKLFDEVHILVSQNGHKRKRFSSLGTKRAIEEVIKEYGLLNCKAVVDYSLIADYTKTNKISYIVRGVRNNTDYNYEENMAQVNNLLNPSVETIYIRASNMAISSSMVSELFSQNKEITEFAPKPVIDVMKEEWKQWR